MRVPVFTGACTALVTPFYNSQINYTMLEKLFARQIHAGIPAIVLAGTTGEAPTLSDIEKIKLFQFGKEYVQNTCKIIAGTGSNDTCHAVELSIAAQEAGADAILVVSPYYNKANYDGLLRHYTEIANSVTLPVILYNVPSRTGMDISIKAYKELSKVSNIIGVKEASTDITKVVKILNECAPEFYVWSGNDEMATAMISLGAKGVISVCSNVYPSEVHAMCNAALSGEIEYAAKMQRKLQKINEALFCDVNPIPVKATMKIKGLDCGECRLPLGAISEEKLQQLNSCLI